MGLSETEDASATQHACGGYSASVELVSEDTSAITKAKQADQADGVSTGGHAVDKDLGGGLVLKLELALFFNDIEQHSQLPVPTSHLHT